MLKIILASLFLVSLVGCGKPTVAPHPAPQIKANCYLLKTDSDFISNSEYLIRQKMGDAVYQKQRSYEVSREDPDTYLVLGFTLPRWMDGLYFGGGGAAVVYKKDLTDPCFYLSNMGLEK